ncbi:regulatory protein [Microbotryomycetes sp. JL201]|nr:regulatory protein [Microbotryomycetes sp. JL201]
MSLAIDADRNRARRSDAPAPTVTPTRGPARQGAPASSRDFARSSAGGARVQSYGADRGRARSVGDQDARDNKLKAWQTTYRSGEETLRNDYSAHYVRSGERPQNNLRNTGLDERFIEYPKLQTLIQRKHALLDSDAHSVPPTYLVAENKGMADAVISLQSLRFDAIVVSPPPTVTYDELVKLDIASIASSPGFVWLWVGSGASGDGIGLERGRDLLAAWGYRRSEDIVWLKTNRSNPALDLVSGPRMDALLTPTIEHCLMGIRGTVRRSTDAWFVHCNIDTDVIVWECDKKGRSPLQMGVLPTQESCADPQLKPPELQSIVENFCLGTRRLHLYGSPESLRRGWLTVGPHLNPNRPVRDIENETIRWHAVPFDRQAYAALWAPAGSAGAAIPHVLPYRQDIDEMRPKSPPAQDGVLSSGGLGRGRGAGLGVTRSAAALAHSVNNSTGRGHQQMRGRAPPRPFMQPGPAFGHGILTPTFAHAPGLPAQNAPHVPPNAYWQAAWSEPSYGATHFFTLQQQQQQQQYHYHHQLLQMQNQSVQQSQHHFAQPAPSRAPRFQQQFADAMHDPHDPRFLHQML